VERVERLGTFLQWLSLLTLVGLVLWLEGGILLVAGGGLMLLMLGGYLPTLERSHPGWSIALSGMALLAISMFAQNLLTGLYVSGRLPISKFNFVFLLFLSFMFGVIALGLVVGQFLPPESKPRDYPGWGKELWSFTSVAVVSSLILVALAGGIVLGWDNKVKILGLITTACTLLVSGVLGAASVSWIPSVENLARGPLPRQVTVISAVILSGGFLVEWFRGDWLLWLLPASAFASVWVWLNRTTRSHQSGAHFRGPAQT